MNSPKLTKEGNLKKYRNILHGWSTRYFKLERSYLHYFEAKHAPEPVGSITRGDIADVQECTQFPGKLNVFELHTQSGVIWYLQANSADDMSEWLQALMPRKYFRTAHLPQGTPPHMDHRVPVSSPPVSQPSWQGAQPPHGQQWPSPQGPELYPQLQGAQAPYIPPQQGTPPMQGHPGQMAPQFDPRMFAAGGPLYDPRVHGMMPYSPPPPYSEQAQQAEPLPSKTSQ